MVNKESLTKANEMKYKFLFHSKEHSDEFFNNSKSIVLEDKDAIIFLEIGEEIDVYWGGNSLEAVVKSFHKLKDKFPSDTIIKIHAGEDKSTKSLAEKAINAFTRGGCHVAFHYIGYSTKDLNGNDIDTNEVTVATSTDTNKIHGIIDRSLGGSKFEMQESEMMEYINNTKDNHVFIIKEASEIAGVIFCNIYGSNDKKQVFIRGLAVDESYRGKGYSNKLLYKAFKWAEEKGASNSMLWVEKNNTVAIKLYEKFGYQPYGDQEVIFQYVV